MENTSTTQTSPTTSLNTTTNPPISNNNNMNSKRPLEEAEDHTPWTVVRKKRKLSTTSRVNTTPTNPTATTSRKFKLLPHPTKTPYQFIRELETLYPALKISVRPNLHNQFVITPKDGQFQTILHQNNTYLQELTPAQKTTKAIIVN